MATNEVELFVCERYRPMVGWSADYLLPTDRHAHRARGSKKAWRTLPEAEAALLPPGWVWAATRTESGGEIGWEVDSAGQQADKDGWTYGSNFSCSFEGAGKAGMQMFARWRRLVRMQHFPGTEALQRAVAGVDETAHREYACPNVDLEGAGHVSRLILEALAAASLYGEWSAPNVVRLKAQLVEGLVGPGKADGGLDAPLASFVDAQRNVATRMAEAFKNADDAAIAARAAQLEAALFPAAEQEAYAVLAIRHRMPQYACAAKEPEHECAFKPLLCKHDGCGERCSAKAAEEHDAVCKHKPMACDRCGERVPRGELRRHATAACPLREARCTFSGAGCTVELKQNEVQGHLEECTQAHLMLLLNVVQEQQETIRTLTTRCRRLEDAAARQEADRVAQAGLERQVAALEAKLTALEKGSAQDSKKSADEAKKRADAACQDAKKHADGAVTALRTELKTSKGEVAALRTSVGELGSSVRGELAQVKTAVEKLEKGR